METNGSDARLAPPGAGDAFLSLDRLNISKIIMKCRKNFASEMINWIILSFLLINHS